MKRNLPINYGNKISLLKCNFINNQVLQGETVSIEVEWKLLDRMPLNSQICYYLTDRKSKTILFFDTSKPQCGKNIFYSQMKKGDTFMDKIEFKIPFNLEPARYEINSFVFPQKGFEPIGGKSSKVWPEQRVIMEFEVSTEYDLEKKFSFYKNSEKTNFFDSMIAFWKMDSSFAKNPNIFMWADFAFTTNSRGARIVDIIQEYVEIKDKNFLDIGCAYCGFLVAAKLSGAKEVEGVDINKQLIDLGIENMKDYGINAKVQVGDILDVKFSSNKKGHFDVITCNDVIEHVLDPELAIKNISLMLARKGLVMFEIPNMNNPKFVIKDGHFSVFAITLLERDEALKYYKESYEGDYSSVGFYHTLEIYKKYFKKYGLNFHIDKNTIVGIDINEIFKDIQFLKENLESLLIKVDQGNKQIVSQKVNSYLKEFDKNKREMSEEDLILYYGPSFWTVIGRK